MPKYRISGPYWDGSQYHPRGTLLEFEEGTAPARAVLQKGKEAEAVDLEKAAEEEAALQAKMKEEEAKKAKAAAEASAGPKAKSAN